MLLPYKAKYVLVSLLLTINLPAALPPNNLESDVVSVTVELNVEANPIPTVEPLSVIALFPIVLVPVNLGR